MNVMAERRMNAVWMSFFNFLIWNKHIKNNKNYSDDFTWGWLAQTPQGELVLLNPPSSVPSRVKKTQYVLS